MQKKSPSAKWNIPEVKLLVGQTFSYRKNSIEKWGKFCKFTKFSKAREVVLTKTGIEIT